MCWVIINVFYALFHNIYFKAGSDTSAQQTTPARKLETPTTPARTLVSIDLTFNTESVLNVQVF